MVFSQIGQSKCIQKKEKLSFENYFFVLFLNFPWIWYQREILSFLIPILTYLKKKKCLLLYFAVLSGGEVGRGTKLFYKIATHCVQFVPKYCLSILCVMSIKIIGQCSGYSKNLKFSFLLMKHFTVYNRTSYVRLDNFRWSWGFKMW